MTEHTGNNVTHPYSRDVCIDFHLKKQGRQEEDEEGSV